MTYLWDPKLAMPTHSNNSCMEPFQSSNSSPDFGRCVIVIDGMLMSGLWVVLACTFFTTDSFTSNGSDISAPGSQQRREMNRCDKRRGQYVVRKGNPYLLNNKRHSTRQAPPFHALHPKLRGQPCASPNLYSFPRLCAVGDE